MSPFSIVSLRNDGYESVWTMLCSALQLRTWYGLFVGDLEAVLREEDVEEGKEDQSRQTTIFKVEAKALHYVEAPQIYQSGLQVKRLNHLSGAESATHFCGMVYHLGRC